MNFSASQLRSPATFHLTPTPTLHTFSLDSGTRQATLLCLSRKSWNCRSLMTNLSASLRASSPAFSPSISKHWNTWRHRHEGQDGGGGGGHARTSVPVPALTFQRTGSSLLMSSCMSSSTLKVLTTVLILNATLYRAHQPRIL